MMMKDILRDINLRIPYNIPEDSLVVFINSALRRFGRHIGRDSIESFKGIEGISLYPVPGYVNPESIKAVTVNGRAYSPRRYDEELSDMSYSLTPSGYILLSSVREGDTVNIYHTSCYEAKLRSEAGDEFDTQDMGIDGEYADAVIFSAISDYMETCEDIVAANNYRSKCDEIVKRAMQGRYQKRGKYPVTKDVMK